MSIGDVCTRTVVIIEKSESVSAAARLMREFHVGDVVVIERRGDKNYPVGILTDRDIVLELVAQGVDLDEVAVGDVMSDQLITTKENADVYASLKILRTHGIRRLPIVGDDGSLVGILSLDDCLELVAEQINFLVAINAREQSHEQRTRPHFLCDE